MLRMLIESVARTNDELRFEKRHDKISFSSVQIFCTGYSQVPHTQHGFY